MTDIDVAAKGVGFPHDCFGEELAISVTRMIIYGFRLNKQQPHTKGPTADFTDEMVMEGVLEVRYDGKSRATTAMWFICSHPHRETSLG